MMTHDGEKIAIWERGDGENLPMARRARAREPRIDGLICPAPRPPWIISAPPPRTHVSRCAFRARSRRGPVRGGARVPLVTSRGPVASGRSVAPLPRARASPPRRVPSPPRTGDGGPSRGLPRGLRVDLDADVVRGLRVRGSRRGEFSAWARKHPRVGHRGAPADLRQLQERQVRGGILRVRRDVAHRGLLQPPGVRGEPDAPDTAVHGAPVHRHDDRPHRAARLLQRETRRILGRPNPQEPPRRRPRGPRGASAGRLPPGVAGVPSRRRRRRARRRATTPGASPSRATRPAPKTRATTKRRRPRVRRDSGAFSVASVASEAASELAERGEAAAETARRPSTRRVSFGGSAGGHRAARLPPVVHQTLLRSGPGVGRAARRRATGTEAARTPPEEDPEASSARPFLRGGFSAWLAGASTPGARARRRGRAELRADVHRGNDDERVLAVVRTRPPLRRRLGAGSRGGVPQRRDGEAARARRASFSLWPLSRNPSAAAGRRGGEGVNGERGERGCSAARRGRRGGGYPAPSPRRRRRRGPSASRRSEGSAPRERKFFHSPARGWGSSRVALRRGRVQPQAPDRVGSVLARPRARVGDDGDLPRRARAADCPEPPAGSVEGLSISMFALAVLETRRTWRASSRGAARGGGSSRTCRGSPTPPRVCSWTRSY